jgi:hypothetical protein
MPGSTEEGPSAHEQDGVGAFLLRVFARAGLPWRARITHAASGDSALVASGHEIVAFIEAQLARAAPESVAE